VRLTRRWYKEAAADVQERLAAGRAAIGDSCVIPDECSEIRDPICFWRGQLGPGLRRDDDNIGTSRVIPDERSEIQDDIGRVKPCKREQSKSVIECVAMEGGSGL